MWYEFDSNLIWNLIFGDFDTDFKLVSFFGFCDYNILISKIILRLHLLNLSSQTIERNDVTLIQRTLEDDQTLHILLIWFSGTLHAELCGLPLPTFTLLGLLVVTSPLVLEVFARQLLLSGIVSPLTSVLAKVSQHSADTLNLIISIQPLPLPSDLYQRLWFVHDYDAL